MSVFPEPIGEVLPCAEYTNIEWRDVSEIVRIPNSGYRLVQGEGAVRGRLFGGCIGPLRQIMDTEFFPDPDFFEDCILLLDDVSPYGNTLSLLRDLRAPDAAGVFRLAAGLLINRLSDEEEHTLTKFLKYEARREDILVLTNADFVHRTPMTVLPMGAMVESDSEKPARRILESGAAG